MTNKEILKKAIEKATKNGYSTVKVLGYGCDGKGFIEGNIRVLAWEYRNQFKEIIFSHSFAKAFWGGEYLMSENKTLKKYIEEEYYDRDNEDKQWHYNALKKTCQIAWQYHLQQMVREEEPLKYLEKFL